MSSEGMAAGAFADESSKNGTSSNYLSEQQQQQQPVSGKEFSAVEDLDSSVTKTHIKRNKYALACAMLASMTSILLGYDIGVMSGAQIYIQREMHLSNLQIELLSGSINLYSLIGSPLAGY